MKLSKLSRYFYLLPFTGPVSHFLASLEPEVPPNAQLSLEVELVKATDTPDVELMPPSDRIALAIRKRERGNVHYQRTDYAFAVNSYSIALQITESNSKGELNSEESGVRETFSIFLCYVKYVTMLLGNTKKIIVVII